MRRKDKTGNWLNLKIGDKIKIGKKYSKKSYLKPGQIITLIKGFFDYYNGLYDETQVAPSIWNKYDEDYDSIYHLFGNDLEDFQDCQIVRK